MADNLAEPNAYPTPTIGPSLEGRSGRPDHTPVVRPDAGLAQGTGGLSQQWIWMTAVVAAAVAADVAAAATCQLAHVMIIIPAQHPQINPTPPINSGNKTTTDTVNKLTVSLSRFTSVPV